MNKELYKSPHIITIIIIIIIIFIKLGIHLRINQERFHINKSKALITNIRARSTFDH